MQDLCESSRWEKKPRTAKEKNHYIKNDLKQRELFELGQTEFGSPYSNTKPTTYLNHGVHQTKRLHGLDIRPQPQHICVLDHASSRLQESQ